MKKLIFTLLCVCLAAPIWAQDTYTDTTTGLCFTVADGDATIVAPTSGSYTISNLTLNDDGTYTIPSEVTADGTTYGVTKVNENAFQNQLVDTSNLIHFVVPANITFIGELSFGSCTQIEEVTIEYSETELTEGANNNWKNSFYLCPNIKTVHINRNLGLTRGNAGYTTGTFSYQTSIETIYISKDVTSLPNHLFYGGSSNVISSVYCYSATPPTLGTDVFPALSSEATLYVYESSKDVYADDTSWTSLFSNIEYLEDEEEEQPEGTLMDVETGLYFEIDDDGVVSIVSDATGTYSNSNLVAYDDSSWTIPATVTDKSGTSGNVTRIGDFAFSGSAISGHIVIPAYVTNLAEGAFMNSTHITEVTYEYSETNLKDEKSDNNTTQTQAFYGCSGITTVNLNRDVTIGRTDGLCGAFVWQTSVETINIGAKVTLVPSYYFRNTSNHPIKQINVYATTPPSFSTSCHPFDRLDDFTLAVPYGCSSVYEASECWSIYITSADANSDTGNCTFVEMDEIIGEEDEGDEDDTLKDTTTGLYFEVSEDGVVSIIAHEGTTYSDDNLVAYEGGWTIPETVTDSEGNEYSVTRVSDNAFANSGISGHLVIPGYVTNIGEAAFDSCTGLTEVTFEYSETPLLDENAYNNDASHRQSFRDCTGVTTVNLYRDVNLGTSGGKLSGPFVWQNSITTINIGPRVTEIPAYMFRDHNSAGTSRILEVVNCYAQSVPTTTYDPFSDITDHCVLNVPYGLKETYENASYSPSSNSGDNAITWGEFFTAVNEMDDAYSLAIESEDEDGKYYATFYCGEYNIELEGATAYVVSDVTIAEDTGYLEISEIGDIVPAGTAVIISADAEANYAAYATTEGEAYTGTNYLLGYDTAQTTTGPAGEETGYVYYMLSYDTTEQTLGFYYGAEGGAAFISAAHKAYLAIPETVATSVKYMSLKAYEPGEETGITEVGNTVNDGKLYDLAGRRVVTPIKGGVYITNGKKLVF